MQGLVLAGGRSSRMGTDKALLTLGGEALFRRAARLLQTQMPIFFSARPDSPFLAQLPSGQILFDQNPDQGPGAALLAAYRAARGHTWFVLACDFALAETATIQQLLTAHHAGSSDLTYFVNPAQIPEPLFAIWTPRALKRLEENFSRGQTGPRHTLQALSQTRPVVPLNQAWLTNANTPAQWAAILDAAN